MEIETRVKNISVANDFSRFPAGRFIIDGPYSGQKFRDEILYPAIQDNDQVVVTFDGVAGLGSSFLEEAFGGLIREHGLDKTLINEKLRITSSEEDLQEYVKLCREFIEEA